MSLTKCQIHIHVPAGTYSFSFDTHVVLIQEQCLMSGGKSGGRNEQNVSKKVAHRHQVNEHK